MKHVRKTIKYLLRIVAGIFIFIGLYFIVAGIACCISVNDDFRQDEDGVTIAVISNGVHTDIAVPAKNDIEDWTKLFPYSDVRNADSSYRYASFGWGDKGFYIETPTWADLKASTAVKAMFWMSTSAMHLTWRKEVSTAGQRRKLIRISRKQYAALCSYIKQSFTLTADGKPEYIKAPAYGYHDAFYEAKGTYNLFETCNVWTGSGLKTAGVRMALWTPFEKSVFQQLPE